MSLPVSFGAEARLDILSARAWYEQHRPGWGAVFEDAVDEVLRRIAVSPEMQEVALRNIRRCKLKRFPYVVYYRIGEHRVEVIAVLHGRRDTHQWQNRI